MSEDPTPYRVKRRQYNDDIEKHPDRQAKDDWVPDYEKCPQRVVCSAMFKENRIITGARHFDRIMLAQMEITEGIAWWRGCEQGFIDQFGKFLTREEAWVIAERNGQIFREAGPEGYLTSENLY